MTRKASNLKPRREFLRLAALTGAAALTGNDIRKMTRLTEGIIVIGNESKGIHPDVMQLAAEKITIPKPGRAESLNAAVATAIILSHIV